MITSVTTGWTHHVTRLLASCILGIFVWLFLRMQYDYPLTITIPLATQNLPESRVVTQGSLRIALEGHWRNLYDFIKQKPAATINVKNYSRGLHEISLTHEQLNLPPTVRLAFHPTVLLFINPSN